MGKTDAAEVCEPPAKRSRGLFAHYKKAQLLDYISLINDDDSDVDSQPFSKLVEHFPLLKPLLESILCIPAS